MLGEYQILETPSPKCDGLDGRSIDNQSVSPTTAPNIYCNSGWRETHDGHLRIFDTWQ